MSTLEEYVETFKAYSQADAETQAKAKPMIEKAIEEYNNLKLQQLTPEPPIIKEDKPEEDMPTYNG